MYLEQCGLGRDRQVAGPVRWLASVSSSGPSANDPCPGRLAQGEVPQSSPAFRMGGFFVAYVLGLIAILVWSTRTSPPVSPALAMFGAISVLCAFLPLSFESRYYSFWMLTLAATVLAVGRGLADVAGARPADAMRRCARCRPDRPGQRRVDDGRKVPLNSGSNFSHLARESEPRHRPRAGRQYAVHPQSGPGCGRLRELVSSPALGPKCSGRTRTIPRARSASSSASGL